MRYGSLILEKKEFVYVKQILNITRYSCDFETKKSLQKLSEELKEAHIIDDAEMPMDVIRLNSRVTLVFNNGLEKTFQVVAPKHKDVAQNKISVLATMGAALLGYSEGDIIVWDFPTGRQKLKIVKVEQEERSKNLNPVI
ncbi:GreA/GreB family elongation factor [Algibacter pectinivorans]|uniref:Regulator of nucleoside diphosphate kinase n=1 Tax=Algibacter pectinivorans TaxID=870482 RepID=A0A1I1RR06_9FLAO|nr:GreA/GreB family elongation factor [Algibacter pectinivorans]SFD36809.1 regulator of nucleoside diphosphate kinase [Algibacter pectinivorans]